MPHADFSAPLTPTVSVCIPTYNYGRFVGRAVQSVLAQTYGEFELIVCDNASTDNTSEVLASFDDPRLRVYINNRNLGLFGNFARCLELARGEFVKFLCADDWLAEHYLADTLAVMNRYPKVGLVAGAAFLVDVTGQTFGIAMASFGDREHVPAVEAIGAQADGLNIIGMPSNVLVRRAAAIEAGGFDPAFAPASDLHLWLKLLSRWDLGWVPRPASYLRIHATKPHDYGSDPSESTFLSWVDVASRPGSPITSELLDRALYSEAERSLLYVLAHLARGRVDRARRILGFTALHVRWSKVVPRFARRLPQLSWSQAQRILARRSGRLVLYAPTPRLGPRREGTARGV